MRRLVVAAAVVACVLGCGDSTLSGSLSALFPLSVSGEVIQRNSEAFQVSYLYNEPTAIDIVAAVGVSLYGITFVPGTVVQLDGDYLPGHAVCTVVHHAAGEPEQPLPAVAKGTLHLAGGGNPGDSTSGDFSLAFVDDGSYGSGRTLYGSFGGIAQDAGF